VLTNTIRLVKSTEVLPMRGMENLVADVTSISLVDGERGRLFYRGIAIEELAAKSSFEETCFLLFFGSLPNASQLAGFRWKLRHSFRSPEKILRVILEQPKHAPILPVLQTCLAAMGCLDPLQPQIQSLENLLDKCMRIVAQTLAIVTKCYRHKMGEASIQNRDDLNFVKSFLYLLNGTIPNNMQTRFLEIALICQMDHGFNSSTFTARTVASTLATPFSACSAALGALSGPLHGGACLEMFSLMKTLRQHSNLEDAIEIYSVGKKQYGKMPGIGHKIYQTTDPRARIFEALIREYMDAYPKQKQIVSDYYMLKELERIAPKYCPNQNGFVNLDFWSPLLYQCIGIPIPVYPAIFATARITGWLAHILELRLDNKLYRPKFEYVGRVNQTYVNVEDRE
jgi:citrate synthase